MNKEQAYDEKIFPLMAEIIKVCKEHKIAMLASFSVPTVDDPDLLCTSCLLRNEHEPPAEFLEAWKVIVPRKGKALRMVVRDADGNALSDSVILP